MIINCIVIDDEPSAQAILKSYIAKTDYLNLKKTFNNAIDAIEAINNYLDIDLIFLDINMPKISGLKFYKSLKNPPSVIFTTAYPQYAIDGFNLNAVDYLLKPFSFDRFYTAVQKALSHHSRLEKEINRQFLLVKANKTLHKIKIEDIEYVEAFGDYVKIHKSDKTILTYSTFSNILKSLPKDTFVQTHKSFAVNLKKIKSINGNLIELTTNKIPIGQKFKELFFSSLKS